MPPTHRLTRADFKVSSSQKARRLRGAFFTLAITPLPPGTPAKTTCVVSKKAASDAVERNLIKRRIREILRPLLQTIKQPAALAFYATTASKAATFEQLSNDIKHLLKEGRVL